MDALAIGALFVSGLALGYAFRGEVERFRRDPVLLRVKAVRRDLDRISNRR